MNTRRLQLAMFALVASIHVLNTPFNERSEDWSEKPGHDGSVVFMGSGLAASRRPGMTGRF